MQRRVTVVIRVCVSVCMSVCLSVKSNLTSGVSVRPENTVTYSASNEGKKFVGFSLKLLRCRDPVLPPLKTIRSVGHFSAESAHAHYRYPERGGFCTLVYSFIFLCPIYYIAGGDSSQGVLIGILVAVCVIVLVATICIVVVIMWNVKRAHLKVYMYVQ